MTDHVQNVGDGFWFLALATVITGIVAVAFLIVKFALDNFLWEIKISLAFIFSLLVVSYIIGYLRNTDDVLKKVYKRTIGSVRRIF